MTTTAADPAASTADGSERHHDVLVVGAGFSGIGVAIALQSAGLTDFAILEKTDRLGGTWRDNTYPGCACDVPSAVYQLQNKERKRNIRQ